jgi:hypothetical protein
MLVVHSLFIFFAYTMLIYLSIQSVYANLPLHPLINLSIEALQKKIKNLKY